MKSSLASAASAFGAVALCASAARADAVVESVVNGNPSLDGAFTIIKPDPTSSIAVSSRRLLPSVVGATSYDETVSTSSNFHEFRATATARQTLSLVADGDTVSASSTAVVGGTCLVTGTETPQLQYGGVGGADYSLFVTVARRSSFVLSGSCARDALSTTTVQITFDDGITPGAVLLTNDNGATSAGVNRRGVVEAGQTAHFFFHMLAGTGDLVHATGGASWNLSVSIAPEAPAGADHRWTNRAGGGFGTDANWDPQQVPVKDATHTDNAVFDLRGRYTVDFDSARRRRKALGLQTIDRLEILNGSNVTFLNMNLKVDDLSPDVRPSFTVDAAKLTLAGGHLTSNSAVIGDLHGVDATVVVDGAASRWDCDGRLRVGGSGGSQGEGTLKLSAAAQMVSAETRIGAGGAQPGVVTVDGEGTAWDTGNIAVGFSAGGSLSITGGAVVSSGTAVIGLGHDAADPATVEVSGAAPTEVASRWDVGSLTVGRGAGLNSLSVADGASVNASDVVVGDVIGGNGFVSVSEIGASGAASQLFSLHGMIVGQGGGSGDVFVSAGAEVHVTENLSVGADGQGAFHVVGTDAAMQTGSTAIVGGTLTVGSGDAGDGTFVVASDAVLRCGQVSLGSDAGSFGALIVREFGNVDVAHDAFVGGSGVGTVIMVDGNLHVAGELVVAGGGVGTGSMFGTGLVSVDGAFIVDGFLDPTIVALGSEPILPSPRAGGLKKKPSPPPVGKLTIQGNLVVGPTGVVTAEAAGAKSDQLVVTGDATLDGTLVLQFKNGFAPKAGDQFELVHVDGATTGAFASVETRGLAPGALFDVAMSGGAITATAQNDAVALPTVSVKASAKKLLEKQAKRKKGAFTFTRKGAATAALTVSYSVRGTATNGIDYVSIPGTVTIPAKKRSAKVTVQLVDDAFHEVAETIDVAVVPGADYTESLASAARIAIVDND